MRPVSSWLQRFRRPAGVPAAVGDELEAELMPVFAALDEIEELGRAIRLEAEREVERRLDAAALEAERIAVRWKRDAGVERARAEAHQRREIEARARAIERQGEAKAARLRERGLKRIPALVASVVACLGEEGR